MRWRLSPDQILPSGARLEMSAKLRSSRCGVTFSSSTRSVSIGPNSFAKSMCCCGVSSWSGKISTAYFQNACLTADSSAADSFFDRSISPTSATKVSVTARISRLIRILLPPFAGSPRPRARINQTLPCSLVQLMRFRDRMRHRPPGKFRGQVRQHLPAPLFPDLQGARTDVGGQDDIVQPDELFRHLGLVPEHVEACSGDLLLLERGDQGSLVHQGAAPDIHQETVGSQRADHPGIDDAAGRVIQADGDDQAIRLARQCPQVGMIRPCDIGLRAAAVVAHLHAEHLHAPRDRPTDLAQADDAAGLAGDVAAWRKRSFRPLTGPD